MFLEVRKGVLCCREIGLIGICIGPVTLYLYQHRGRAHGSALIWKL
jgi:hypothetical protein